MSRTDPTPPPDAGVDPVLLARELLASGDADLAERTLRAAGADGRACLELARMLWAQHRDAEAVAACQAAIAALPGRAAPYCLVAELSLARQNARAAELALERARALEPDAPEVHAGISRLRTAQRRLPEALAAARAAARRAALPAAARAYALEAHWLACEIADWSNWRDDCAQLSDPAAAETVPTTLGPWLAGVEDPAVQLAAARRYAAGRLPPAAPRVRADAAPRRLRVGYYSSDFRRHPIARLVPDVLAAHDRARVEVVAISVGPPDADAGRARVIAAADRFVDLHDRPDAAISDALAALRLDVLVEISGHAAHARLAPLARRPAPVQASWLGYAGTLAAPGIDWLIADEVVVPRSEQCHYAERIVRLPGGFFPHRAVRAVDAPLSRAAYGLPETGPVLCSFNALFKLTPPVFGAWLDALVARPDAVLWMAAAPCAHERLRAIAVDRGVAPARLVFAGRVDSDAAHLARYRVADLLLDTFPFGSHTTASDALWAGCPLLALRGRTFASRVAASILHAEGLPDLVVDGLDAYRERLVSLLADPTRLAALRARLRTPGGAAPEPATLALARALEDAYVELRTEAAR